ncbi:MAG: ABC transporter permease [Acidobacteria bacterium]|nr:MAG: ABC transporter permease [Acidobacteriota bacterium]
MNISSRTLIEHGATSRQQPVAVLTPRVSVLPDRKELWRYRDLLFFLVWRDVKARYAQSVLGVGWAIIQPLFSMIVFTVVFGSLAKIDSEGRPYAIFSYTALVPWTYFSNAVSTSTGSLITSSGMLSKVYFPRLIIPLTPLLSKLIDFGVGFSILFVLMLWFQVTPTLNALYIPLLLMVLMLAAGGMGMWLTSLAVQYRDVNYGISFGMQLLMYAAPVVYPASLVPDAYRSFYALNPMVGVIEGFRAGLLGTTPMPWDLIAIGSCTALLLFVTGALFFRHKEAAFADVV